MKHHYWEAPIVIYLFLGGLGGGVMFLSFLLDLFVVPGASELFAMPLLVALAALAAGCFFLVFELGQPLAFWRVFTTATAIIKWGAVLLTVALICGFLCWASFLPGEWIGGAAGALAGARPLLLCVAGVAGLGIMVYTGVMLSTLKAHAFWATPALPVLFTVSALSTACAALSLSVGGWPAAPFADNAPARDEILAFVHMADIVLVLVEIAVLLVMVLSFLGAGNRTAKAVARRWVMGRTAPLFWIGMVGLGLVCPLALYLAGGGSAASQAVAPMLVLCGGLLLRYLCVYSDERAEIPGESRYYRRIAKRDADFVAKWKSGENLY